MMSTTDKALLNGKRVDLKNGIDLLGSTILDELITRKVITDQQVEVLKTEPGNINQVGALLTIVLRGDKDALDHFNYALRKTGHTALANETLGSPRKADKPDGNYEESGQAVGMVDSSSTQGAAAYAQDEEEFDGLDANYEVKVTACTKKFYKDHCDEAYDMDRKTRGQVLIFSVNKVPTKKPRHGTKVDADKLESLFQQLHMDVEVCNDDDGLTADGIIKKVREFASPDNHKRSQCCVLVLLSHGSETKEGPNIAGTDGKPVSVWGLREQLLECNNLQDVPKLVLVQACRRTQIDGDEKTKHEVVCYASQRGSPASRDTSTGSRFIKAVVKVFEEHACNTDVVEMLNKVSIEVKHASPENAKQEPDIAENTLNKKWYLFPGCP